MIIIFLLIGIGFTALGLSTYLGFEKFWWWSESSPIVPTSIVFGAVPAALLFFLMAYIFQPSIPKEARLMIVNYLGTPLLIITIVLSIWQPRWLKPKWLRWLETNHSPMLELLREEARKEEWSEWNRRVSTQEGLEEWVEEVRYKYKLDHSDQRFIGNPHDK